MSLLRRATWGILALLVVLAACRKKEEGPEPAAGGAGASGEIETQAVAGDLPAGAAVVVSVYDLESYWTRLKGTQLYTQVRAIPQVDSLLDPAANPKLGQALQQFQAKVGMPLNEQTVFGLLGKKVQVGLYPTVATASADTAQRVVLVADMGDKDALGSILNTLRTEAEGKGAKFSSEEYRGVELTVASDADGKVSGIYGFHKEKLVASTDQAGIQSAVDALDGEGGTMAKDTLYSRALTHVGEANVTLFVRQSGMKGLVGAMQKAQEAAGDTAADAGQVAQLMDKYSIQSATVVGSHWTDDGLLFRSYAMFDPTSSAAAPLREMLQTPPSQVEVVGYFPDSTLGFYSVNFLDAPKVYDFALGYVKDVAGTQAAASGGDAAAQVDQAIAQFQLASGMDIRTDILGWIGKEAAAGLNGVVKGGLFPVPELAFAIQTTDPARAKAFFDKLEAKLVEAMQQSAQGFPLQFQEEDYKGVKLRYAPTPMGEGLAPAYALHEDYALIALSRGTLKRMLDAKTGAAPGVASNPGFQALSGFFPGEANFVGYANTAQLFTEMGALFTTFQQMGQASGPSQDTVTQVISALKNLQSVGTYGVGDSGGFEQRVLVKIQ